MALACCGRGRDDDYFCHAGERGVVEIILWMNDEEDRREAGFWFESGGNLGVP